MPFVFLLGSENKKATAVAVASCAGMGRYMTKPEHAPPVWAHIRQHFMVLLAFMGRKHSGENLRVNGVLKVFSRRSCFFL
jgi:hypothetical protein